MWACRCGGLVVAATSAGWYLVGALELLPLAMVLALALAWQAALLRPGVVIGTEDVELRGLLSTRRIARAVVASVAVEAVRRPLDAMAREVDLVVTTTDGRRAVTRWVAWQDLVSPFVTSGTTRPATRSQERVLTRLRDALAARPPSR
jgi:hypothetical protein